MQGSLQVVGNDSAEKDGAVGRALAHPIGLGYLDDRVPDGKVQPASNSESRARASHGSPPHGAGLPCLRVPPGIRCRTPILHIEFNDPCWRAEVLRQPDHSPEDHQ